MITPNKITSLDESIMGKMSCLMLDDTHEITLKELMALRLREFSDIGEFVLALDALYVLGSVEFEEEREVVRYVS